MREIAMLVFLLGGICQLGKPTKKRKKGSIMRLFNSLQVVALFAAAPWLLGLLYQQEFPWDSAAKVAATILYGIFAIVMVAFVYIAAEELK